MTTRWDPLTRRNFLRGAGTAALTLPILPSLLPKAAQAQALNNRQKTFIGISMHNGIDNMYSTGEGSPSIYMPVYKNMQTDVSGIHPIHWKSLASAVTDGGGALSKVFDSAFNPYLPKMQMMQGLDWLPIVSSHHGAHFGNLNNALLGNVGYKTHPAMATIDQVMAYSTGFYKNPGLIGKSVVWTGNQQEFGRYESHTFGNPGDKIAGAIVGKNADSDPAVVWDRFFKNFTKAPPAAAGPTYEQTLVDLVLGDYKSFSSNPRLAKIDRARLDQHVALLHETEKSLKYVAPTCNNPPARPGAQGQGTQAERTLLLQTMNSVIVSLISCGLCHSFTGHMYSLVNSDPDFWHRWSHGGETDSAANEFAQVQAVAKDVVLDLVKKLDQSGLLDDSLVVVPQEHSKLRHESWNLPVVTFGSAGGAMATGKYVDYRHMEWVGPGPPDDVKYTRFGYPMNQMLANVLTAMGVQPAEFEPLNREPLPVIFTPGNSGYGCSYLDPLFPGVPFYKAIFKGHNLSGWLPMWRA